MVSQGCTAMRGPTYSKGNCCCLTSCGSMAPATVQSHSWKEGQLLHSSSSSTIANYLTPITPIWPQIPLILSCLFWGQCNVLCVDLDGSLTPWLADWAGEPKSGTGMMHQVRTLSAVWGFDEREVVGLAVLHRNQIVWRLMSNGLFLWGHQITRLFLCKLDGMWC